LCAKYFRIVIDGKATGKNRSDPIKPTRLVLAGRVRVNGRLAAVGRLDLATSGLLLLTTDTRLADWLTDPASAVPRTYLVTARGEVSDEDAARLMSGVESDGERLAAGAPLALDPAAV
jgi:pseudouridine synthase